MRHATHVTPQPSDAPTPRDALAAYFAIAELWSLTTEQQIILLGAPARSTFFKWKKEGGLLSADTRERISHIVSIYKALQILFSDPKAADQWLHRRNKYWDGLAALDVMLGGKL